MLMVEVTSVRKQPGTDLLHVQMKGEHGDVFMFVPHVHAQAYYVGRKFQVTVQPKDD